MPTDRKTVDFIVDQAAAAGAVHAKPMFGEYGLYCDGKMVGIIGDDQLFIKPTDGGQLFAYDADEESPYPRAKTFLSIEAERWDDGEWLADLIRITAAELPAPKPRPAKRSPAR